jgi:hypothetical protein
VKYVPRDWIQALAVAPTTPTVPASPMAFVDDVHTFEIAGTRAIADLTVTVEN